MSTFVLKRNYELQLPTSFVDIDSDEMEYVDGGRIYISNSSIKNFGLAIGINPIPAALAYVGYVKLRGVVLAGMSVIAAKVSIISRIAGIVVGLSSWLTAGTIANALIQRKGIHIDWNRTASGFIYGIDIGVS